MNCRFFSLLFLINALFLNVYTSYGKEYKSFKSFQKITGQKELSPSDWLKSDRKKNSQVWQQANSYNLENQLPQEYKSIVQRRDFYEWYYKSLEAKGHEVIWPKMAHYISKKLQLTKVFPYSIFTKKSVKTYAYQGSEHVFNAVFFELKSLYHSVKGIHGKAALNWDKDILHKEQIKWLYEVYIDIDVQTLHTIKRMSEGKGFYRFLVPKDIRFSGDITKAESRYIYALEFLRPYCKTQYK